MRRIHARLLLAAVLVFAVGCSTAPLDEPGPEEMASRQKEFIAENNADYDADVETMIRRMELEVKAAESGEEVFYDILALHGGGASGGFAAGFLKGWGEVDDPEFARPFFDHVTGASSGALVAPFAYLGTDEAYEQVFATALDPPFQFKTPGPFSLWPTRSSLMGNKELAATLQGFFDDEMIDGLARGAGEHRSLLIGVTDFEMGLFKAWEVAREAATLPPSESRELLPKVVLASAAVPILLPPVEIDGHLYLDGGTSATVFVGLDARAVKKVAEIWRLRHKETAMPTVRIWVIINSKLYLEPEPIRRRYVDIAARTISVMMSYDRQKALLALSLLAEEMNGLEGVEAQFRWITIPESADTPDSITEMQDLALIRGLVDVGYELGRDPASWNDGSPELYRLPK